MTFDIRNTLPSAYNHVDRQYMELLHTILEEGVDKSDRTGVGTRSIFGHQMKFDLSTGFPLITTKKVHLKSVIVELLWFLQGTDNAQYLDDNQCKIWKEWTKPDNTLGPIYGVQWLHWNALTVHKASGFNNFVDAYPGINQIENAVQEIKNNPNSRRNLVSTWNPTEIPYMALAPCHTLFQLYVVNGELSLQLYQRSADVFLGVPFNIASYALLTMMLAQVTGLKPGKFIHTLGDAHIYNNHFDQVRLQLSREPRQLPTMKINPEVKDIFSFTLDDFTLEGYDPHPTIKAPVAV